MRLIDSPEGKQLRIVNGKTVTTYRLIPLDAYQGRAVRLEKIGAGNAENYDVLLNGPHSTCECLGFLRHGHGKDGKGCKHIAAVAKLAELGKLPPAPPFPKEPIAPELLDLEDL